jgi:hypothetical protein
MSARATNPNTTTPIPSTPTTTANGPHVAQLQSMRPKTTITPKPTMTPKTTTATLTLLALLTALAGCLLLAPLAGAEKPWWGLRGGGRPAYLKPNPSHNEIQQLTTTTAEFAEAPEQAALALSVGSTEVGAFATEPTAAAFFLTPLTAANLQSALEGVYGSGNVTVTEAPAPAGSLKFTIESIGADAGHSVAPIEAFPLGIGTPKMLNDGQLYVSVENLGDASLAGDKSPVKITDTLPAGLAAVGVAGTEKGTGGDFTKRLALPCVVEASGARVSCTFAESLAPYAEIEMRIAVVVKGALSGELNEVSASGGEGFLCDQVASGTGSFSDSGCTIPGAGDFQRESLGPVAPASIQRPVTISSAAVPFGVEDYELAHEEEGGTLATQAGVHPFQQTTSIALNQGADIGSLENSANKPHVNPAALAKDLHFRWPAGLIGNPKAFAQCTDEQFFRIIESGSANLCPPGSAVGVATVSVNEPSFTGVVEIPVPLFNLKPHVGEPARFGFNVTQGNAPVVIDTAVRTGSDYGVTVKVENITQSAAFLSSQVTVWGVPGDQRHDRQRGWSCLLESSGFHPEPRSKGGIGPCGGGGEQHPPPFLSLPTSCTGPLHSTVEGDSWSEPGPFAKLAENTMPALDGCNRLPFSAEIRVAPDGQAASTPTGLNVDVHVPQQEDLNGAGLASSNIKDIRVLLPPGFTTNPSSADGLQACSQAQIGYLPGESNPPGELHFTEALPEPLLQGMNFCPDAAKIATVTIKTPLLPDPLEGSVYLASPAPNQEDGQNPFKTLVALYILAKDPVSGVLVKLPGRVTLNQQTGQIEANVENNPQAAFEDAELHFFGGARAPLSTPALCGPYETQATFTPWSGSPPLNSSSTLQITSGPNASPCQNPLPFAPTLATGSPNVNAGSFSALSTTISREDGNQDINNVQLHFAPGMSGILAGIPLCPEAQANAGSCSEASKIGETIVSVGLGGDPFTVTAGKVYLTEKYGGAPFGLSIVNPADAGPFHLGKVIVRAKIEVDPLTTALTVTTGQIPHILDGIPLQIKHVNVNINRLGFTFNPTNCNPQSISGTIGSVQGASAAVSSPFQVTNCANLKFTPDFKVSTAGKTSKANGASLSVKLTNPKAPLGTYANFAKVKVSLPKQLPSRLTTIQKACASVTFEKNPAGCPKESILGQAKVITPLLPVPLTGPAYFVSHGGEAFPDLTIVLQGYGVSAELIGNTKIRGGITTTTFNATPDVPFSSFELTLPQGRFSALAANADLCKSKLAMPTEFTAQNGAVIRRSTPIAVTGCKKHPLTRKQKLAKALKACKKKHRGKRASCERAARRRFGAVKARKGGGKKG